MITAVASERINARRFCSQLNRQCGVEDLGAVMTTELETATGRCVAHRCAAESKPRHVSAA